MSASRPRKPTAAQRSVLQTIRDGGVYYNRLSPRRSGISAPTFTAIREAGWIEFGEQVPVKGRLLLLTDAGEAALTGGPAPDASL